MIPGFGITPEEGMGYPLWYSWASLVAQMIKNPPAVQETWVRFLGWEDLLEEGKATHFSILESPEDSPENPHGEKSLVGYSQWSHKESDTTE